MILASHKNCKINQSLFVFKAKKIRNQEIKKSIILENIELNQKIQVNIIIQDNIYIIISEYFSFFAQIYKSKFQKIADHIYQAINMIL
jgi:hypothetical protein